MKSNVTVKGTLRGCDGISINGLRDIGDTLLVDGATIDAHGGQASAIGTGLYLAGKATTTIRNSDITGHTTGIEIRAGVLTIESGTIKGEHNEYIGTATNGGASVDGVALAVSQHCTRHDVTVTVNEGVVLETGSDTAVVVTDTLVRDTAAGGSVNAAISCTIPEGKKVRKGGTNVTVEGVSTLCDLTGNAITGGSSSEDADEE